MRDEVAVKPSGDADGREHMTDIHAASYHWPEHQRVVVRRHRDGLAELEPVCAGDLLEVGDVAHAPARIAGAQRAIEVGVRGHERAIEAVWTVEVEHAAEDPPGVREQGERGLPWRDVDHVD